MPLLFFGINDLSKAKETYRKRYLRVPAGALNMEGKDTIVERILK